MKTRSKEVIADLLLKEIEKEFRVIEESDEAEANAIELIGVFGEVTKLMNQSDKMVYLLLLRDLTHEYFDVEGSYLIELGGIK